jgi:hypothetical protein
VETTNPQNLSSKDLYEKRSQQFEMRREDAQKEDDDLDVRTNIQWKETREMEQNKMVWSAMEEIRARKKSNI